MSKIAVLTGAGAGVGRATVEEFARQGYDVALLSRDQGRLDWAATTCRRLLGLRGQVVMQCDLRLRFDYGSLPPWCEAVDQAAVARVGPNLLVLRAPVPITIRQDCQTARFSVVQLAEEPRMLHICPDCRVCTVSGPQPG